MDFISLPKNNGSLISFLAISNGKVSSLYKSGLYDIVNIHPSTKDHKEQGVCGDYVSFDEDIDLVFGEKETKKSVSLIIMNDEVPEDKETFAVI